MPPDRLESFLNGIHRSAKELLRTTEAILDLSRLEQSAEPPPEATDVIGTVREALTTLQPLADRKGLALCLAREAGAPDVVMTSAQHLRQVIVNLVANSIKFSSSGEIVVRVRRIAAKVAIDVEDRGIGIPATCTIGSSSPSSRSIAPPRASSGARGSGSRWRGAWPKGWEVSSG